MKEMDGPQQGREKKSEINGLEEMLFCCCLFVCGFGRGCVGLGRWSVCVWGGGVREQEQTEGNESHWVGSHYWRHCSYY